MNWNMYEKEIERHHNSPLPSKDKRIEGPKGSQGLFSRIASFFGGLRVPKRTERKRPQRRMPKHRQPTTTHYFR